MSTFWTPDGERPLRRDPQPGASAPSSGRQASPEGSGSGAGHSSGAPGTPGAGPTGGEGGEPSAEQIAAITNQLANTPAELVVANHAYGIFELAAIHLSLNPPQLDQARTAIDALTALLEGMQGRLGEPEAELVEGLGSLRMAFVQVRAAQEAGQGAGENKAAGEHGTASENKAAGEKKADGGSGTADGPKGSGGSTGDAEGVSQNPCKRGAIRSMGT